MTPEQLDLKRATGEMLLGVGGLEAAAGFCRVQKSRLGEYKSENSPDAFVPLDVIADLEPLSRQRSGWPHVTRTLCRRMGGVFVAVPAVRATGTALLTLLARHGQESVDVSTAICGALADGKVDATDARRIRTEVAQAMELLALVDAELSIIEQEGQ